MQQGDDFFRRPHPARKHDGTVYHEGRSGYYAVSHHLPDILDYHNSPILAAFTQSFQGIAK
jgi:hypothetical protein